MSSKKVNESLSQSLGIEFVPEQKPEPKKELITTTTTGTDVVTYTDVLSGDEKDSEEDFQKSREVIEELLEKGSQAVESMLEIAENDENARSFEVVATLIKTVSEASKDLYSLHETRKKLKELTKPPGTGGGFNIDKAVFVGSTKEVLHQMKQQALEQVTND